MNTNQYPQEKMNHEEMIKRPSIDKAKELNNKKNNNKKENDNMLNNIVENIVKDAQNKISGNIDTEFVNKLNSQLSNLNMEENKTLISLLEDKAGELMQEQKLQLASNISETIDTFKNVLKEIEQNNNQANNKNNNKGDNVMENNKITAVLTFDDQEKAELFEREVLTVLAVERNEEGQITKNHYERNINEITIMSSDISKEAGEALTYALMQRMNSNVKDYYGKITINKEGKLPRSNFKAIEHFFAYTKTRMFSLNSQLSGYKRFMLNFTNGNAFCKEFIVIGLDQEQKDRLQDKIDKYEDFSETLNVVQEGLESINTFSQALADKSADIFNPVVGTAGNILRFAGNALYAGAKELQKTTLQIAVDSAKNTYVKEEVLNSIEENKQELKNLFIQSKIAKKQKRVEKREQRRAIRNSGKDTNVENSFSQFMM